MKSHKKLIEVALPLPEINDASAYDKMPGIGPHPKGIHHWWARLPLPTARAVLFASVVDDPGANPEKWPTEEAQNAERERLFDVIRMLLAKKMHTQPELYAEATKEIVAHIGSSLPTVVDPFAGGGSIPLEANRLGFEAHAADLNPVAVLLNRCNLELVPRWLNRRPVNPKDSGKIGGGIGWRGSNGLAADLRHYSGLIRDRAYAEVRDRYPLNINQNGDSEKLPIVAWIWARTVASPIPAARGKHVPLISTYWLSNNKGSEAWLHPIVDKFAGTYQFEVLTGTPSDRVSIANGTKIGRGAKFRCLLTNEPIDDDYIKREGKAGNLGMRLLAVVGDGKRRRVYLPATEPQELAAALTAPLGEGDEDLATDPRNIWCAGYGLTKFRHLFTPRQLLSLVTLSNQIKSVRDLVRSDATNADMSSDEAEQYANTVITFLALALDRTADFNNAQCRWSPSNQKVMNLFSRQAIPMVWDFAEANLFGESVGAWKTCSEYVAECVEVVGGALKGSGQAHQADAAKGVDDLQNILVSTDPPYYDNISYAGLSDFFYVWLRRTIGELDKDLFGTLLVPKLPELTASPERFDGDKNKAKEHFEKGFRGSFTALRDRMDERFPLTVYYAFKQDDEDASTEDPASGTNVDLTTGWETLLEALISSGFQITGTWPVRASQKWRQVSMGANALASYIVLACRPRSKSATQIDRRLFVAEMKRELPAALRHLQQGNVAPVDFAQAAIGPGMAIFSQYSRILESSGSAMSVRTALSLINQTLTEVLSEQEDEFDNDTRWAIAWFEQQGFSDGEFGQAELLSKAKVTSVSGLQHAGIIASRGGKVRLLQPNELPTDWDPEKDRRLTVWELTHHLLRVYYYEEAGEAKTADLLKRIGTRGEIARELAYRLFNICERKKRSQEALAYNALVLAWPEIARLARESKAVPQRPTQTEMYT